MQHEPNSNHVFFELLRFPVTETYKLNEGTVTLEHRGAFQVIHNPTLNVFLLKLGAIDFALDKSLQIIKAFSDQEKYPAYLIPSFAGFYMVKILDNNPNIALNNLETILDNTCDFRTKEGLEQKLGDVRESIIDSKMAVMIEVLHRTKDALVKTFTPQNPHPNYTMFRNFEDLVGVDTNTVPMVDITPDELERAKMQADEVVRNCQTNKYWTYFCGYGGTALDRSVSYFNYQKSNTDNKQSGNQEETLKEQPKENFSVQQSKTDNKEETFEQPKEQENFRKEEKSQTAPVQGECDPKKGCDNIDTVHTGHSTDAQEIVGTENQRLPSYEVHHSKEHVIEGLDAAICRLEDAKLHQSEDMPPLETCQIKEDPQFAEDLLRPLSEQDEKVSKELGGSLADKNKPAEAENKDQEKRPLDYYSGDPYRRDLAAEMLHFKGKPEESESWGSNVSNPSETLKLSEAGLSNNESLNENNIEKPLTLQGTLSHSQSLNEKALAASPSKDNVAKQNISEKQAMKQKNVSDQAVQKENATLV